MNTKTLTHYEIAAGLELERTIAMLQARMQQAIEDYTVYTNHLRRAHDAPANAYNLNDWLEGFVEGEKTDGDTIPIWLTGSGVLRQISKANLLAQITGGGVLATGGFTLTVPATGTAALLSASNVFTAMQTIAVTNNSVVPLTINGASGLAGKTIDIQYNGTAYQFAQAASGVNQYALLAFDNGSSVGPHFFLGRNSNASTPAAGYIDFVNRAGTDLYVWADASAVMRIGATLPTNAQDGSGTVIGAQTSMAEAKNISDVLPDASESLRNIITAAKTGLRTWNYKSGAYNGEQFPIGLVTDLAPRYGMDRDSEHPSGKSLNIPVAIGDLFAAVAMIAQHLGLEADNG